MFYCCFNHQERSSFPTRRSSDLARRPLPSGRGRNGRLLSVGVPLRGSASRSQRADTRALAGAPLARVKVPSTKVRSEEHTSELQSHVNLVCRLLLEKKIASRAMV